MGAAARESESLTLHLVRSTTNGGEYRTTRSGVGGEVGGDGWMGSVQKQPVPFESQYVDDAIDSIW